MSAAASEHTADPLGTEGAERRLPPVTEIAVATLTLIVIGGVYLAAKMPAHVTLAPAIGLLGAAVLLLAANALIIGRIKPFAWRRFTQVFRWTLIAYAIIAGMLEYVFVYDGVRGGTLAVLSGMLAVFAVNVPLILSFTVARHA